MKRPIVLAFVMGLLLACAAPNALAAAPASAPGDLLVLSAARGTLVPAAGSSGRFTLTLRDADRTVVWFADRPGRQAGTVSLRDLARDWARLGFVADPPNGAIEIAGGDANADTLAVELGRPRYDAATRTLRVAVRRLPTTVTAGGHARGVDRRLPRRFGRVSLFVDNLGARDVTVRFINAATQEIALGTAQLTGGNWAQPPVPGFVLAPGRSVDYDDLVGNAFLPLGGRIQLFPASGGTIATTWSWMVGSAPTGSVSTTGLMGLTATATTIGADTPNPVVMVIVSDAPIAR